MARRPRKIDSEGSDDVYRGLNLRTTAEARGETMPNNPFLKTWNVTFGPLKKGGSIVDNPQPFTNAGQMIFQDQSNPRYTLQWGAGQDRGFGGTYTEGTASSPPTLSLSSSDGRTQYLIEATLRSVDTTSLASIGGSYSRINVGPPGDGGDGVGSWVGTEIPPLPGSNQD
jgi:hypothetical protein